LLDYTVHGRSQERVGNADAHLAPHGVYPAAGQDRWLAIAICTEAQWQALCEVMRRPDLGHDSRFATLAARLRHREALDTIVAAWTREHSAPKAEAMLQARGVPASAVQNSQELSNDPQLIHRGHFVQLPDPLHDTTTVEGSRFRLSRTPARLERAGPTLGRDNQYVLETILGYSSERIAALTAAGILR
jgi:crotonobetainyl-CoA:carnitine CoA-transferase CaiB-like acyl-CoA transferase